jgi:NhaP-type Na+/H+ or K+/H+ antiporter
LRHAGIETSTRRLIAWFGPRGLSTLLLILLAVFAGVPGGEHLFAIASFVVLLSIVVHGGGVAVLLRRRPVAAAPPSDRATHTRAPLPTLSSRGAAAEPEAAESIPERITVAELQALWQRGEPVLVIDARTERTYALDEWRARDAVRLPPDDAVRAARALALTTRSTLVVYCA